MITIEKIDTNSKSQVKRFIDMPYHLYKDCPQWVPPIRMDMETQLNRQKYPFYEHSDVDFFMAVKDGRDVGRIATIENKLYNNYHHKKVANFYYYEAEDDIEISEALFAAATDWAKGRGLNRISGPKGLGPLDGYGILVDGFEHRQMMTMMLYNHSYIPKHMETLGFVKEVDFTSCYAGSGNLKVPDRIHRIADRVQKRGTLRVVRFKNKKDLIKWAPSIGKAYNNAFVENWEYYPLTDNEVDYILDSIITIADPRLIKIIVHGDDVVGFLLGFADISKAIQKSGGYLFPTKDKPFSIGIIHIMLALMLKRSEWIALNGMGILPEFQGHGGNALLYSEMEKTVNEYNFKYAEMTQIAESAVQMQKDLINLGGIPYKTHRVYTKSI
jgi:GNAT superfamily N-acetyltransferase